jgi:hypothetical protein
MYTLDRAPSNLLMLFWFWFWFWFWLILSTLLPESNERLMRGAFKSLVGGACFQAVDVASCSCFELAWILNVY